MRLRLSIAAAALAALWSAPADCRASSFGLTYSRQCTSCGFCVRPYNAFSSVTCGVANVDCGGGGCGCGWGCNKGFSGLNPRCCGWGGGWGGWGKGCGWCRGCGWRGCRGCRRCHNKLFCCRLRGRLFGMEDYPVFSDEYEPDECEPGAFGSLGQEVPFFGTPAITNGYNPGCHMCWGWNSQPVNVPGYSPPPGPYVQPPNASCSNVWLPPQPFPGMYGIPYSPYQMPYYYPPSPEALKQHHPVHGRNLGGTAPASYEQPSDGQGGYYVPASWWYPAYGAQQQWYAPWYYGQYQQQ